jgi:hypothetical protein
MSIPTIMAVEKQEKDYYTPRVAFEYLIPHLTKLYPDKSKCIIWECCCGEGHLVSYLKEAGYTNVIATDIKTGHDMLTYEPDTHYDIIITNPPFYQKRIFIERLIQLGKPTFALLPTMSLESNTIRKVYKDLHQQQNLGILLPPKMIHYIPKEYHEKRDSINTQKLTTKQSRTFFHSSWFAFHIPSIVGIEFL